MTCYHPIALKRIDSRGMPQIVNCGRCIGCRLEYARQWAVRIMHEAQGHEENCFLTLTYRDEELTWGSKRATLVPKELQRFWKRLRRDAERKGRDLDERPIRYFAAGEYGDKLGRPHYHACVFGYDAQDKRLYSRKNGLDLYSSEHLDSIWSHGDVRIGSLTFESASYVARYIMKKHKGKDSGFYDEEGIEPEFVRMSRRPGIGRDFYDKFHRDIFPADHVISRGLKTPVPRYYSSQLEKQNPEMYEEIKAQRKKDEVKRDKWLSMKRLKIKERVKKSRVNELTRKLE